MFVSLKLNNCINDEKILFLRILGRLWSISFFEYLVLANWAAWFTTGLFCFGYLPDSWANDQRLCLAQERVLEGAVGDSGFQGTLPVATKPGGFDNWLHDSGDVVDSFPSVSFGLFF